MVRMAEKASQQTDLMKRLHVTIRGAVQGVGFRPFVYRLATEMRLPGWVLNSSQGVFIEVEGEKHVLDAFLLRIEKEKPPRSSIHSLEFSVLDPVGFTRFEIRQSDESGEKTTLVLPDIATCPDCLREIFDHLNRRYLYPFTNCTNCGPRFTIIEALPYDRPNTSMKIFQMCDDCRHEYEDPLDRRFHAQPNACPKCGPHLELWNENGEVLSSHHDSLLEAADAIRRGKIVAMKGLGGFHLVVDARNDGAVRRLRERKHREEKPLALIYPTLEAVKIDCVVSELEERLLLSPESPIVLLSRQAPISKFEFRDSNLGVASSVAPQNPYLGVMLPYTPLHHILMKELGFPVVATSGNLSDEPICTDEGEALKRLSGTADVFLVHDRPIVRHVDDSVARVLMGRELVLRRARGYAPLPIRVGVSTEAPVLAVGAHLKNTVALSGGSNVFISQHIGDLETQEAFHAFQGVCRDLPSLYGLRPESLVCDMHPAYLSTQFAKGQDRQVVEVQHHYAHIASCMAENELDGTVLGVSWDGTGYGLDGTIWGGEFLVTTERSFQRVASFRQFRLPGGERAIREPRRTAIGILYEIFGDKLFERTNISVLNSFTESELRVIRQAIARGVNSPQTSSVGRLFDAVASFIGLRQRVNFEGQAAMEVEFAIEETETGEAYQFRISNREHGIGDSPKPDSAIRNPCPSGRRAQSTITIDWEPMILGVLDDVNQKTPACVISAKFHNSLVEIILEIAKRVGEKRVVLSGGCFQNKYLTERAVRRLEATGFQPYWHQRVPPNDGGIALGQVFAASRLRSKTDTILDEKAVPQAVLESDDVSDFRSGVEIRK
jgi:hydrogenase maturation protein HypF